MMACRISLGALVMALVSTLASAQADADAQEARRLFEEASVATDEGRHTEARALLEESLEKYPTPAAAFNLALTFESLGEVQRARATIRRLEDGEYGEIGTQQNELIRSINERLDAALASLSIRALGPERARITLDDEEAGVAVAGGELVLRLDPGHYRVAASAEGFETDREEVFLEGGGERSLVLRLEPAPTGPRRSDVVAEEITAPADEDGDSSRRGMRVGVGVGVALGVVIAVVVTALVLRSPGEPECATQTPFGCGIDT